MEHMGRRHELTDDAWERIAPLLPANPERGGRWRDHRQMPGGIVWKIRTGADWRDIPERYGPWQTIGGSPRSVDTSCYAASSTLSVVCCS
ncbi:transposase [Streptosporangium canum]|uniref:transposase n=1 Tax=Streptosporangium canum TaxID=324952 RepID=UPI003F4E189E